MPLQRHRFANADLAADALAGAIAADLRAALSQQSRALLLVSGGRSPIPMLAALACQSVDWARIDVSLVDERSVPPGDEEANARLIHQHLLTGDAAAAGWIALMPDALFRQASDPLAAAQAAADQANGEARLANATVIVLGMGNDGHTASLFVDAPQWPQACLTTRRYVALQPACAPHARVSLSLSALLSQRRCYLWAVGAEKSATLARIEATVALDDSAARCALAGPIACLLADPGMMVEAYCD